VILLISFGLISTRIIARNLTLKSMDKKSFLFPAIMQLTFFPTIATMAEGQITLLILLLVLAGWSASRKGADRVTGLIFGIALSLNLFTGLLLIFFLIGQRWKLLAWDVGTFLTTSF